MIVNGLAQHQFVSAVVLMISIGWIVVIVKVEVNVNVKVVENIVMAHLPGKKQSAVKKVSDLE